MPTMIIVFWAALIAGIIVLNVWYYGERAKMTPEERKKLDEEIRWELSIW